MTQPEVRVRFAPSPTGYLHIGGVRTAIFNLLFARKHGGKFILRIEDTDVERNRQEAIDQILESMKWLGLSPDEGPYFQSERMPIYQEHLQKLLASGKAYKCYCPAEELEKKRTQAEAEKRQYKYDGTCRNLPADHDGGGKPYVVRVRSPENYQKGFEDLVMGFVPFDETKVDDWILARSNGVPTYNFCVVVDDASMRISHVIRGNDHVANTPRQILLYQAFGFPVPQFAHMPLIHGTDGSKLSKRKEDEYQKQGFSVMALQYKEMGYLPHALNNYLARLGWSHGDQEIFSREELESLFDLDGVGKAKSVLDPEKLKWVNQQYLLKLSDEECSEMLAPFLEKVGTPVSDPERRLKIGKTLKPRASTLLEMAKLGQYYFVRPSAYDAASVKKWWKADSGELLKIAREAFATGVALDEHGVEGTLRKIADEKAEGKLGRVAQPVRIALVGSAQSPSLFDVMSILGREESLARMDQALAHFAKHA